MGKKRATSTVDLIDDPEKEKVSSEDSESSSRSEGEESSKEDLKKTEETIEEKSEEHVVDIDPKEVSGDSPIGLSRRIGYGTSQFQEKMKKMGRKNEINLTWKNLTFEVTVREKFKKSQKQILKGISGYAKAGQVLAILGSSGAGKTSLLNVLAGRVGKSGNIQGDVRVNGAKISSARKDLSHISGYVMQDDVLLPNLTVRETLMYSALLRLPTSISYEEKMERVEDVIRELGLTKAANTQIGSATQRGISGGERKRVNIGVELITDPSLMFLDEPTSGLDSFTAYNIMESLIGLANNGRTIVCTIHQPRSNIYSLFDSVMLLSNGEVAYFGPAKDAVSYFGSIDYTCPKYANPADFLLDISCLDTRTPELLEETTKTVSSLIKSYKESTLVQEHIKFIDQQEASPKESGIGSSGFATSYFYQLYLLFGRGMKGFYREKVLNFVRLFQNLLFAIIIGLIYLRIDNDQTSITDRTGALFFILINQAFGGMFASVAAFPLEKSVFMRERASRMYRVSPYYLTKTASELPSQLIFPIIFCAISYYMIGFHPGVDRFFIFVAIVLLATFAAVSLGLAISAASPSINFANAIAPIILVILLLFGGFYINNNNIPKYFIWIQWASFVKYSFAGLMVNEFQGLEFRCKPDQFRVSFDGNTTTSICPITSGQDVLVLYGLTGDNALDIWQCCLALVCIIVVFRLLGYIFLRVLAKKF